MGTARERYRFKKANKYMRGQRQRPQPMRETVDEVCVGGSLDGENEQGGAALMKINSGAQKEAEAERIGGDDE